MRKKEDSGFDFYNGSLWDRTKDWFKETKDAIEFSKREARLEKWPEQYAKRQAKAEEQQRKLSDQQRKLRAKEEARDEKQRRKSGIVEEVVYFKKVTPIDTNNRGEYILFYTAEDYIKVPDMSPELFREFYEVFKAKGKGKIVNGTTVQRLERVREPKYKIEYVAQFYNLEDKGYTIKVSDLMRKFG